MNSDFRKILRDINDNRLIAVCHFHFIETFRIPQVDFQRFTVEVSFLDLFGCASFLCGSLFLPDRCFQKIGIQQCCVQLLIGKDIELDFQNQLRVVDIAGHPLTEHPNHRSSPPSGHCRPHPENNTISNTIRQPCFW